MPDIAQFITDYGYWALFIGCLAEGETVTLLGGIAAHHGLLSLPWVLGVVALGGALGDQILYFVGRALGPRILAKFHRRQYQIKRANQLINHHPLMFVLGVRFMYGFRILGPLIIGASKMPPSRFVPMNILGACLWAIIWVLLGYFFGQMMQSLLGSIDKKVAGIFFLIAAIVIVLAAKMLFGMLDKKRDE